MKKTIAMMLTLAALAMVFTGCGSKSAETQPTTVPVIQETTQPAAEPVQTETEAETQPLDLGKSNDALAILESVWADYPEDERFPVAGGDFDAGTFLMGGPGAFDMTRADALMHTLLISRETLDQADGAATLMHGMNGNIFTSGLLHMVEGTDLAAIADEVKASILNNQWICGAPETMLIASIDGEYLLISFGNGEIMESFQGHLEAAVPQLEVLHTGAIFE